MINEIIEIVPYTPRLGNGPCWNWNAEFGLYERTCFDGKYQTLSLPHYSTPPGGGKRILITRFPEVKYSKLRAADDFEEIRKHIKRIENNEFIDYAPPKRDLPPPPQVPQAPEDYDD